MPFRFWRVRASLLAAAALALAVCVSIAAAVPLQSATSSLLDDPARSEDDHRRDEGFHPLQVYAFFGVQPGMAVGDLMPSRGYHTRLLSGLVGESGQVVAILTPTANDPERSARSAQFLQQELGGELANVQIVPDLQAVAADSLDLLLTVRNYHDLGNHDARLAALPALRRVLKPGGILAVVDAYTDEPDERDESVHRINDDLARREITSAGFEFVAASDLLVNPDDTYDFDGRERAGVRGATRDAPIHRYFIHRWVHKYRKPSN